MDDAANDPAALLERALGDVARDVEKIHDNCRLHDTAAFVEEAACGGTVYVADLHENSLTAVLELLVRRAQVDHQIPVRLAQPDHGARRDHVEHELRGGTGFHPCRSGDDFGSRDRQYENVDDVERLAWR